MLIKLNFYPRFLFLEQPEHFLGLGLAPEGFIEALFFIAPFLLGTE
jgi:hypothetical protein